MTKKELQKQVSFKLPKGKIISIFIDCYPMSTSLNIGLYENGQFFKWINNKKIANQDFKLIYKYIFNEEF